MQLKKILIVVNPVVGGVEYHRQLMPHYYLNGQEGWEVSQINEIDTASDDFLKQFQIVQFSRMASFKGQHREVLLRLAKLHIKSIVDIDDYWHLPAKHPLKFAWDRNKIALQITDNLMYADCVTTATAMLASKAEELTYAQVEILPNAIDPAQPQFEIKPTESEKTRFGWVGGYSHLEDIQMLSGSLRMLNQSPFLEGKYQLYLMGFNPEDKSGIYNRYEKIFTNGLRINSEIYYRINGTNVFSYAQGYNLFDVALAPLAQNLFNNCKSELKIIEAGFMKKAVIASDIENYRMFDESKALLVEHGYNYKGWYHDMKFFIENKNAAKDFGEQLYESVKEKYHIKTVNEKRMQLYESLIN